MKKFLALFLVTLMCLSTFTVVSAENENYVTSTITFGASEAENVVTGAGLTVMSHGSLTEIPEDEKADKLNLNWQMNGGGDSAIAYTTAPDGTPAVFTTKYWYNRSDKNYNTPGHLYLKMDPAYTSAIREATIEITYYDMPECTYQVCYSGYNNGALKLQYPEIKTTGSGEWKTATINITDAYFHSGISTGLYDGTLDFRIGSQGNDMYIKEVTITGKLPPLGVNFSADASWNVTAAATEADKDVILAVYDADKNLVEVKTAAGAATLAAAGYVNNDDYTIRCFLWDGINENLIPYRYNFADKIALTATPYVNNVKLAWNHIGAESGSYEVYCDGEKIAATENAAYIYGVLPGDHTYYVTCGSAKSDEITVSSLIWATNTESAGQDEIAYVVAGETADTASVLSWGSYNNGGATLTKAAEDIILNEGTDTEQSIAAGTWYSTSSSEAATIRTTATSADGITKNTWFAPYYWNTARNSGKGEEKAGLIFFTVSSDFTYEETDTVQVVVEYLDTADMAFRMQYATSDKASATAGTITGTGSNEWKTASFNFPASSFAYIPFAGKTNTFRLYCTAGELYVSKAAMLKNANSSSRTLVHDAIYQGFTPVTDNSYTDGVSFEVGADNTVTKNGLDYYSGGDGTVTLADGYMIANKGASARGNIYCRVDDNYIYGRKDNYVIVEVTCVDNAAGAKIGIQYNGSDASRSLQGAYCGTQLCSEAMTGDGTEKTFTIVLNGASFVNTQNPGLVYAPINASFGIGSDMCILLNGGDTSKFLTVKKIVVRNANHKPIEKVTITE